MERKDLSYKEHQKQPMKEIVIQSGLVQKVPKKVWETEIITNPTGPTARRAKLSKDPDLEKIKVARIDWKVWAESPIVEPQGEVKTRSIAEKIKDLSMSIISPKRAKELGFRTAEEGKTDKSKGKN